MKLELALWWLTAVLILAFPILNFVYWPLVLESGALPADGDSIMIPMVGSVLMMIVASPILLTVAWFCLRRFNPETRITTFRRERLYRSAIATMACTCLSLLFLREILTDLGSLKPWYEYLWSAYFLLWPVWFCGLRAAVIDQMPAPAGDIY